MLDIYGRWIVIDNSIINIYVVQDSSWSSHFLHLLRWDVTDEQLLIEMILPRGSTGQQIELLSCAT